MDGEEKTAAWSLQHVIHLSVSMMVFVFHIAVENVATQINILIASAPMATMEISVKPSQRFHCMETPM